MSRPASCLVEFADIWQDLQASSSSFEKLVKPTEALTLELLRELTTQRRATCEKSTRSSASDAVSGFALYLPALAKLRIKEAELKAVSVEWTSPMAGRGGRFYRMQGIGKELAMALWMYAGALRQCAYEAAGELQRLRTDSEGRECTPQDDAAAVTHATAAVTRLREAAGVFELLCSKVLPPLKATLSGDRPAELLGSMSMCLHHICLAEAQVVAAHRAVDRGSSPGVAAGLHTGATEDFDRGAKVLRDNTGDFNTVSERLRKFLAIGTALAQARGYRFLAVQLREKGEPGMAESACIEADGRLSKCLELAEQEQAWRGVLQNEREQLGHVKRRCHNDRTLVYFQSLPAQPPSLPNGTKVVKQALPYTLDLEDSINAQLVLDDKPDNPKS